MIAPRISDPTTLAPRRPLGEITFNFRPTYAPMGTRREQVEACLARLGQPKTRYVVYLLCLAGNPLKGRVSKCPKGGAPLVSEHYLGYSTRSRILFRLWQHEQGLGSRFMAEVKERGLQWRVARLFDGGYYLEAALKRWHGYHLLCPHCSGEAAYARGVHYVEARDSDTGQCGVYRQYGLTFRRVKLPPRKKRAKR